LFTATKNLENMGLLYTVTLFLRCAKY